MWRRHRMCVLGTGNVLNIKIFLLDDWNINCLSLWKIKYFLWELKCADLSYFECAVQWKATLAALYGLLKLPLSWINTPHKNIRWDLQQGYCVWLIGLCRWLNPELNEHPVLSRLKTVPHLQGNPICFHLTLRFPSPWLIFLVYSEMLVF